MLTLAPGRFVSEASAGSGLRAPSAVVTAFAGIVFVRLPLIVMITLRVSVHLPPAGKRPPLNEKELVPETPLRVPPQLPTLKCRGFARTIPPGIVSVKAMPVNGTFPGLINRTLMVEEAPPKTVNGSKPLTTAIARLPGTGAGVVMFRFADSSPGGNRFSLLRIFARGIVLV